MKNSIFNLRPSKTRQLAFALGLTCCTASLTFAQPDVNNGPKAENPTNRNPRNRVQERIRTQLVNLGVTDAPTQQTLINYIEAETIANTQLMQKGQKFQTGLRGGALTDAQVTALLNDYQGALEDDKARRAKSEAALKKALDLSKMPKVEATLTLMGVYGDGPNVSGVMNFMFNNRMQMGGGGGIGGGGGGGGRNRRNRDNAADAPAPAPAAPAPANQGNVAF